MDIHVGDHVLANLAPFIGVVQWCRNSVRCNVLEVDETRVRIVTDPPYREVDLWISCEWIEAVLERGQLPCAGFILRISRALCEKR